MPDPAPRTPAQPGLSGPAVCYALLRVSGEAGPRHRAPALLQGPAPVEPAPGLRVPVEPATIPHAGHWVPALPWDASRPSGFAASGSAAAASPRSGPHLFRGPVCTGDARFSQRDRRRSARCLPCQSALLMPLDSPQSAAADRRFRRLSAALLPRAGAFGPPPAGRPSAGQPSAEPKLFGSGKNETVLPRRRSGRTNVLSGPEDRLSRRLAGPVSAHSASATRYAP